MTIKIVSDEEYAACLKGIEQENGVASFYELFSKHDDSTEKYVEAVMTRAAKRAGKAYDVIFACVSDESTRYVAPLSDGESI